MVKTSFDAVQEPVVSGDKVCRAQRIGKGSIVISGLVLGTAQVTVAQDGAAAAVETYVVRVVRDAEEFSKLADFINANVPNCKITLTLSPDTRKVLLGGYVWTQDAIRQIYELLVSPDLPQSDIINRLYWGYPPGTVRSVQPTS